MLQKAHANGTAFAAMEFALQPFMHLWHRSDGFDFLKATCETSPEKPTVHQRLVGRQKRR